MNTQSIDGRKVATKAEVKAAGDFFIYPEEPQADGLYFIACILPGERGFYGSLPISSTGRVVGECWGWDGNREKPTLTPSINRLPSGDEVGWHGFLRQGRFESC